MIKTMSASQLLDPSDARYVLHPIRHSDIFKMGKDAIASFWTVEELDFTNDKAEFEKMSPEEKTLFTRSLLSLHLQMV